jgi:hypothetical protein
MRHIVVCIILGLAGCAGIATPEPVSSVDSDASNNGSSEEDCATCLTGRERDAVRRQIQRCWENVPVGAFDPKGLIVDISVEMNRDRTVKNVVVVDSARMANDRLFRTMAESAVQAFKHADCQRLDLPPEKYETWKKMTVHFDPTLSGH